MKRKYAFFLSLSIGVAYWFAVGNGYANLPAQDHLRSLLGVLAQIAATILGFLLAALAILLTLNGETLLRNLSKTGHLRVLFDDFLWTSNVLGVLTMLCLLLAVLSDQLMLKFFCVLVAVLCFSIFLFIRLNIRFWAVLSVVYDTHAVTNTTQK